MTFFPRNAHEHFSIPKHGGHHLVCWYHGLKFFGGLSPYL